jgi:hypothetical protein
MYQVGVVAHLPLALRQSKDERLRGLGLECASRVDDNVMLASGVLERGGVIEAAEKDGLDALFAEDFGLFLFADQDGDAAWINRKSCRLEQRCENRTPSVVASGAVMSDGCEVG